LFLAAGQAKNLNTHAQVLYPVKRFERGLGFPAAWPICPILRRKIGFFVPLLQL
jgi:hypothetical protein